MALCHDERDYAMGIAPDPHARHGHSVSLRRRHEERRRYLASLTPHQKLAYERVEFCLQALGQYFYAMGHMTPIHLAVLHRHFPAFAQKLGYRGRFYRHQGRHCPAVDIAYPQGKNSFWFLTPYFDYWGLETSGRKEVHAPKVRQAALAFLKAWLPDWKWDEVKLP